jgi:hypothetical protein
MPLYARIAVTALKFARWSAYQKLNKTRSLIVKTQEIPSGKIAIIGLGGIFYS